MATYNSMIGTASMATGMKIQGGIWRQRNLRLISPCAEPTLDAPPDVGQPFSWMYLFHSSNPLATKVSTASAKPATTAGTDWKTKATAAAALVTNNKLLYSIIIILP